MIVTVSVENDAGKWTLRVRRMEGTWELNFQPVGSLLEHMCHGTMDFHGRVLSVDCNVPKDFPRLELLAVEHVLLELCSKEK